MIYLVVGIDHASLAPWHTNISAPQRGARRARAPSERAAAAGIDLVVAAVIGPELDRACAHPVSEPVAGLRAA